MRYLPVSYDTKGKNVLVLGGGLLALSKIEQLIKTEFKIYVIADSFVDRIVQLEQEYPDRFFTKEEQLTKNFIFFSYDYLIIATNDFDLNSAFEERAKKSNILYQRCDIFSNSNLLLNNVVSKNSITLGFQDFKLNPTLTNIIKADLEKFLDNYNEEKINILNNIRSELVRKNVPDIDDIIKKLYYEEKITMEMFLKDLKEEKFEKDHSNIIDKDIEEIVNEYKDEDRDDKRAEATEEKL
ncbi:MAG: NAD(P)-dependent oxidoreductase [Peptoniphilus sp.]|nr:NAD(P)-dependent oxidoreductase [Peptoniphilus sp.]